MSRSRQILLVKVLPLEGDEAPSILNSIPLGPFIAVAAQLAHFNTSPDGCKETESFGVLYGPGFTLQLPMVGPNDPVSQVIINMTEEDMAWPVLTRICKTLNWKMMDPHSGRTFGG